MAIVLFDKHLHTQLLPLTYTRSVAGLRSGIFTIQEYWETVSGEDVFVETVDYLQSLYPDIPEDEHLFVDAGIFATASLTQQILQLKKGEALEDEYGLLAARVTGASFTAASAIINRVSPEESVKRIIHPWQIFQWNDKAIERDFALIKNVRSSAAIAATNQLINAADIFIEEGAVVEYAFLNASAGPIYIGKDAIIMEGSLMRGPFALGEESVVKMGAKIYGGTSIGPGCTIGGELKNVVMQGYSNKAHDGYLGDSVIGEWCNFGAGTSNSNVKNTASDIKMWHIASGKLVSAGIKCGLVMGDYSRTAINTSINSGTTIGICCNIFGEGLTPKLLHSFTWGMRGLTRYEFEKALKDIDNWKKFKHQSLSDDDTAVLKHIFEHFSD